MMTTEDNETTSGMSDMQRELEISRKEQELARKELELARREIELLRNMQQQNVASSGEVLERDQRANLSIRTTPEAGRTVSSRRDIFAIKYNFNCRIIGQPLTDGDVFDTYETWERQVVFLKDAYKLSDDLTKVMIGSRLKGKASDWLHSRLEYITMSVDDLLRKKKTYFIIAPARFS